MIEYRDISTITNEEVKLLLKETFDAKLKKIIRKERGELQVLIVTSGWQTENGEEDMEDEVIFYTDYARIDSPFTQIGDISIWEDFMIYYGFHPSYKNNHFLILTTKKDVERYW